MELFERVRFLRKNTLKLSQAEFGEKLGVSRSVIANIELNVLARPEQKEPLVKLISKTFNVNYDWLSTGQGDMYVKTKDAFIEKLSVEYGLGFYAKKTLEVYMKLDEKQQEAVEYFLQNIVETATVDIKSERAFAVLKSNGSNLKSSHRSEYEQEADEFAKMAREQFLLEKKQEEKAYFAKKLDAG